MRTGIEEWFAARIPEHWNAAALEVVADQDEILVVVDLPAGPPAGPPADRPAGPPAGHPDGPAAEDLAGVHLFRESTRDERMALALGAEKTFGRKVSWGARTGELVVVFTTASVPVMTRLRLPERRILDTLIDAGVARSRSEALAWCVRLVGDNEKEWISELRTAFEAVEATRERGPQSRRRQNRTGPSPAEPSRPETSRPETSRPETSRPETSRPDESG